jgi:iron complex transport system substrate-binding protein
MGRAGERCSPARFCLWGGSVREARRRECLWVGVVGADYIEERSLPAAGRLHFVRDDRGLDSLRERNMESGRRIGFVMVRKRSPKIRIASLAPSVTSILLELGAGRELVGVSKWCKDVAKVGQRPVVGDCWKLDVRDVMRLRPSLLIGSVPFAAEAVGKILQQPVAFLALNPRSLADIESDVLVLGRLVNRAAAAERLVRRMRRAFRLAALAARKRGGASGVRPRVYCEAWPRPRISSPPWVAELVAIAGGEMVVKAGARVSDEEVALARPDIIILAWTAAGDRANVATALRVPDWRDVPAVRERRVFVVRDEILNTPGPPLILGVRELRRLIEVAGSRV